MFKILSVMIIGFAVFVAFGSEPAPEKRILFIGNSFTFGGDVPVQVKNIAATARPSVNYHVEMVVRGGTSLAEHLAETDAMARIEEGGWDVVVLQDASVMSFQRHWTASMTRAATQLAGAAREQGAEVIYYAHWAPSTQADDTRGAIDTIEATYQKLATDTGGQVAQAGRVWQLAEDAGIGALYAADGHHSSLKGAYAAALGIVVALGDVDVVTSTWAPSDVSTREQDSLRALAATLSTPQLAQRVGQ